MKILAEINLENCTKEEATLFKVRETVRAVIFDQEGKIALMHVAKGNFHKLPGGGIDEGEDHESALHRECKEEVGVLIDNLSEIGVTSEIKKGQGVIQNSYCYTARVVGDKQSSELTESEKENGFSLIWVDLDEAIKLVIGGGFSNLAGQYVLEREVIILKTVKQINN